MILSYSSYATYTTCPLRYYLEREYPLHGPEYADLLVGRYMHQFFYNLMDFKDVEEDENEIWKNIKSGRKIVYSEELCSEFEDIQDMQSYYSSLKNTIILSNSEERYLDKIRRIMDISSKLSWKLRGKAYRKEVRMYSNVRDVQIFGIADLIGKDEIVELKTGKINGYELQIAFYSLIFYLNNYILPRAKLVSLYTGEIREIKLSVKFIENLYSEINKTSLRMKKGIFTPRRGDWCIYCPYRSVCSRELFAESKNQSLNF